MMATDVCFHCCAFSRLPRHRGLIVRNTKSKPSINYNAMQRGGGAGHQLHLHSNAYKLKHNHRWSGGFSLGVDLGDAKTGVAVSNGYAPRPISVLQLRGQKLECCLIDLAEKEEADEFVIGLPKSSDGKETAQSNKVRSFAGRLAVRAAGRGWRVYLQNEHGTTEDALDFMITIGSKKCARQEQLDAYAAVVLLQRYFALAGCETELVLPKDVALQKKLWQGPSYPFDDGKEGLM